MSEKFTPKKGEIVVVAEIPGCDWCSEPGPFDFKTTWGPWAHGCTDHFISYAASPGRFGVGIAQRWITADQVAE